MKWPALVLFDLDGVLAHYGHGARVDFLAERTGTTAEAVEQALFGSGLEAAADLGEYDAEAVVAELSRRLGTAVQMDDCIAARAASMQADDDVLTLAAVASQRAGVAILTNNGLMLRDHLAQICPPLFPLFAGRVYCSAQFKRAKPDPEIFRECVRKLGATPETTLFIDDKAANAEGARAAGLMAHHFRDAAGLRAELAAHDLLEPSP
jgi:putative hydrolase of the HAD superfamily